MTLITEVLILGTLVLSAVFVMGFIVGFRKGCHEGITYTLDNVLHIVAEKLSDKGMESMFGDIVKELVEDNG